MPLRMDTDTGSKVASYDFLRRAETVSTGRRIIWMKTFCVSFAVLFATLSIPVMAQDGQLDDVVTYVCPAEGAYKNLADASVIRERAGKDFDAVAPLCLAYSNGWKAGWDARETRSVATNYNEQCREQLIREIRGDAGALERFVASISNGFAKLSFLEHCQTYKDGLTEGLKLSRELLK